MQTFLANEPVGALAKHSIAIVKDFNAVKGQKNKLKCISYFLTVPKCDYG
ncbi:MAG: hypothetical protein L3J20_08715 [Flavobacteriaceae bacterium]|nr:hypothetical protein [Flavobacteriaceae bacterium]